MADMSQVSDSETSSQANTTPAPKRSEPVFEVGFHIVPTVGEEGLGAAVEKVRQALGDVEIIKENYPQKMTLAYQVERPGQGKREKYTQSYFGFIKFALRDDSREVVPAMQATLTAMPEVLRYLMIETVREDISAQRQRTVFVSDRLEGKTLEKPMAQMETKAEVSEAELDKSIEALTG